MKQLVILLLMLATFQGYAADETADGAPDKGNDSSQTADSSTKSGDGKKPPKEEEEEEEPDCE